MGKATVELQYSSKEEMYRCQQVLVDCKLVASVVLSTAFVFFSTWFPSHGIMTQYDVNISVDARKI